MLINGFPALSSTSASEFVYGPAHGRAVSPLFDFRGALLCAAAALRRVDARLADFFPRRSAAFGFRGFAVTFLAPLRAGFGFDADGSEGSALSIAAVTSAIGAMPLTVRSTFCLR